MDGMFRESVRDRVEKSMRTRHAEKKRSNLKRTRKKLATALHTHVALIVLVVLVTMDASCVIGQILCDILIIQDKLRDAEHTAEELVEVLQDHFPEHLNDTKKTYSLSKILGILRDALNKNGSSYDSHDSKGTASSNGNFGSPGTGNHAADPGHHPPADTSFATSTIHNVLHATTAVPVVRRSVEETFRKLLASRSQGHLHKRFRRAAADGHAEHTLLEELTHIFHLASLAILSFLVFVTLLKILAMGRKFLHHKLEMFDAFVVTVSWALDLAFLQGIWAKPGPDAATILLFLLPWRVVRIVNSFVMVIEERENVKIKLLKLKLRTSDKKITGLKLTVERYRMEGRSLQGLCRKHGAPEPEINACAPQWKRRRSSLVSLMENCAKLAFVGAIGSQPSDIHKNDDDESDDDDVQTHTPRRITSTDSGVSSVSINSACDFSNGKDNPVFMIDDASTDGISRRGSTTSFGRKGSFASFGRRDSAASWTDYSYP